MLAQSLELTRTLVKYGRAAPCEIDRRQGLLAAARARLPRLAARRQNALLRIAALQGRTPEQADSSVLTCRHPIRLAQAISVGDGAALLRRRPDIRMAERRLAASTARIGVETAALYPDIRLGASLGSTGAAADALSPLTNRYGIGPLIGWTLNRRGARARIEAAEAQTKADLAAFDGMVIKALREVQTALNASAAGLDSQADLDRARDEATLVARTTAQLRRGGKIAALPAIEAERDLVSAELTVAEAQAATNDDQITLFLALGGGWGKDSAQP